MPIVEAMKIAAAEGRLWTAADQIKSPAASPGEQPATGKNCLVL